MIDGNKRLIDATMKDFAQFLQENGYVYKQDNINKPLRGVAELSRYLGISYNKAQELVKSGEFAEAEYRVGGIIRFDRARVDELVRRAAEVKGA